VSESLARAERRLRSLSPEARRAVEALAARIVDEFLHVPAMRLREAAASPEMFLYARVVNALFEADGTA
jgi:glutamyl-tRNA reductase